MGKLELASPVPLQKSHSCAGFDCGNQPLNEYLIRFAWANHRAGAARTYVACRQRRVLGFYSLAFGSLEYQAGSARIKKGLARHPIPIILLARLAVDCSLQGQGVAKGLLKDALQRTLQAADIAGLRAMLVNAKDSTAKKFYLRFGFEVSPVNEFQMMLLLKDLKKILE